MAAQETKIYFDDQGKPVMVQLGVEEYEKLVSRAREAAANKELIAKTLNMLKAME